MNGTIPLHPERALDPHRTYCRRCGGEAQELTLGHILKGTMEDGKTVYYTKGRRRNVEKDFHTRIVKTEEVGERERLPASAPCNECQEEMKRFEKVVAEGGVYLSCRACGKHGVIKAEASVSKEVRRVLNIPPPEPCGLDVEHCKQHGGQDVEQTNKG